jgi:molybdopterin-containing oxidoreductase family membrane subunit
MACLAVPLVVSLHSVVGLDFAASLMPGWQETIFPPYFVVGAMYSGFAMVTLLAALLRWGFRLEAVVTVEHFDLMAKVMLAASLIMGLSYASEWFGAWYHGEHADREQVAYQFTGAYAPFFWTMLVLNVVVPQAFWLARVRRNILAAVVIAIFINIGMWFERIGIVVNTLTHDYAVSMWRLFVPTLWDWALLTGSLGLFALFYLVLVRILPMVSMHEVRRLVFEESRP